jgi:peptidyl-tRNA hydrolase, PTH1 family
MKLIVGLGNPGRNYAHNRHNIGFICLNYFAGLHSIRFDHRQCQARVGIGEVADDELLLAKPRTYVNFSGKAVGPLVIKHRISLNDLLVICDDLDLPLGRIRLRQSGGSGGHKGMRSIISALGNEDFPRIRVGIGRPEVGGLPSTDEDVIVNYVLGKFTPQEEEVVKSTIIRVADAIDCFVIQGMEVAMGRFN